MNEDLLLLQIEKYENMRKQSLAEKESIDKQITEIEAEIARFKFQEDEDVLKEMLNSNVLHVQKNGQSARNFSIQASCKSLKDMNVTLRGASDYVVNPSRLNDFMQSVEKDRLFMAKIRGNQFLNQALAVSRGDSQFRESIPVLKMTNKLNLGTETQLKAPGTTSKKPSRVELTSNVSFKTVKTDKTEEELIDFQITKIPMMPSVQNIFTDDVNRELDFKTDVLKMTYTRNSLDSPDKNTGDDLKKMTVVFPALERYDTDLNDDAYSFSNNSLKYENVPNDEIDVEYEQVLKDSFSNNSVSAFDRPASGVKSNVYCVERSVSNIDGDSNVKEMVSQFILADKDFNYTDATSFKNVFNDEQDKPNEYGYKNPVMNMAYKNRVLNSTADKQRSNKSVKSRSNVKISYKTVNKENTTSSGHKTQDINQFFDLSLKNSEIIAKDKSYVAFYEKNKQVMNKFDMFFKKIETGKSKKSDEKPMKESIFDDEIMLSVDSKTIEEIMTCNSPLRNERLSSLRYTQFN